MVNKASVKVVLTYANCCNFATLYQIDHFVP